MEKLVPKNKLFEWFIRVKSINGSIFRGKYYLKFKEYAEKS